MDDDPVHLHRMLRDMVRYCSRGNVDGASTSHDDSFAVSVVVGGQESPRSNVVVVAL